MKAPNGLAKCARICTQVDINFSSFEVKTEVFAVNLSETTWFVFY